ncbi:MAG: Ig-like domain-containing protein, partial [Planctomycetota bacterium]
FVPVEALATATEHRFMIASSAMDAAGNPLASGSEIVFSTAETAAGGATVVAVSPGTPPAVLPGATSAFAATVTDAAGQAVPGALLNWTSSDSEIVQIDATGQATAIRPGVAMVRASFGSAFDEVALTVSTPPISSVTLTGGASAIAAGASITLSAVARDGSSNPLEGFDFNWTSSDASIATVDGAGVVRSVAAGGPVTITATEPGSSLSADFAVTVIDPTTVDAITVSATSDAIGPDVSLQLSAVAYDSMQAVVPGIVFDWSTSNASIAAVSSTGVVTAVGSGAVQISATASGGSVSGQTDLDVYSFEPTVLRFVVGSDTSGGIPVIAAVLHDASNDQPIAYEQTNGQLFADFGFVDAERVHITYFETQGAPLRGFGTPDVITTVMDVPRGRRTLSYASLPQPGSSMGTSFPTGADTVTVSSGDAVGGSLSDEDVSASPTSVSFTTRQFDDMSVLAAAYDSSTPTGGILSGGFAESGSLSVTRGDQLNITLST